MRSSFLLIAVLLLTSSVQKTQKETTFQNFTPNSHLKWRASHLGGFSPRYGRIFLHKAKAKVLNNQLNSLIVEIDMNSIQVENFSPKNQSTAQSLKAHLKSTDFFNTPRYPISTFQMTKIEPGNEDYDFLIHGNLTILNKTNSITFYSDITYSANRIRIHSKPFNIDRTKWGIIYLSEGNKKVAKNAIISNKITFEIDISLTR